MHRTEKSLLETFNNEYHGWTMTMQQSQIFHQYIFFLTKLEIINIQR